MPQSAKTTLTAADRLKELTDKLEAGVAAVFESDKYADYLKTMAKFHPYSFGNVLLILMQCPHASHVAGFHTWKKAFGRSVKRGEHGIQILAPYSYERLVERDKLDPVTSLPIMNANGTPEKELAFVRCQSFKVAYVYDISQTEGKELPSYGVNELSGDTDHYESILNAIMDIAPVPIRFRESIPYGKGCYHHLEQCIYINEGMSQLQTIKTAIHETSHAKLHALPVADGKLAGTQEKDKRTMEVEAESIAYVVCQHFGIDTSEYSFPYVTSWSRSRDMTELKASLDCIRRTAAEFIDGIEQRCPDLSSDIRRPTQDRRSTHDHTER